MTIGAREGSTGQRLDLIQVGAQPPLIWMVSLLPALQDRRDRKDMPRNRRTSLSSGRLHALCGRGARGSRFSMWSFLPSAERKCPLCAICCGGAGGGQIVPARLHSRRAACLERQVVGGVGVAVPAPAGRLVLHGRGLSGPTADEALLDLPVMRSVGDASRPGRPRRNCYYPAYSRSGSTFAATFEALREPTSEAENCRRMARHARARP
jgi:hypothetical protein